MLRFSEALCTGCGACVDNCPRQCVTMAANGEGFSYPRVDTEKCNGCGVCNLKCPLSDGFLRLETHNQHAFSGFCKDEGKLTSCASGGIATALSERMLAQGGVVYGVQYASDYRSAAYARIDRPAGLEGLKGSKYIASNKSGVYRRVKEDLARGHRVLFVGLPCDVAGLMSVLCRVHEGLITCELFCHGVTSPKALSEYVDWLEQRNGGRVTYLSMRHKNPDWTPPYLRVLFDNGKELVEPFFDTPLGHAFFVFSRVSCYHCKFKGDSRVADISIGDFWGITPEDAGYHPKGVSAILVNTGKAYGLLEGLDGCALLESDYPRIARGNPRLTSPKEASPLRARFAEVFEREGLLEACRETAST